MSDRLTRRQAELPRGVEWTGRALPLDRAAAAKELDTCRRQRIAVRRTGLASFAVARPPRPAGAAGCRCRPACAGARRVRTRPTRRAASAGSPKSIGQVWLYSPDSDEWVGVARNRPLTTGDRIATDTGRARRGHARLDHAAPRRGQRARDRPARRQRASRCSCTRQRRRRACAAPRGAGRVRAARPTKAASVAQRAGRYRFDRVDAGQRRHRRRAARRVFEGRNSALAGDAGPARRVLDRRRRRAAVQHWSQPVRDAFAAWNDDRDQRRRPQRRRRAMSRPR